MWRAYLTNAWLMFLTAISLPYLLIRFRDNAATSQLMHFYALVAQRISGWRFELEGKENVLQQPAVYVFNHQSSLDGIPLGLMKIPRVAIIGKKEVAYIPFIGWAFYLGGNVLINRGDGKQARGQLDAGVTAIRERKVSIAIFAEGSRNRDQVGFLPFKKGGFVMAIDAQVPIVPVVIESYKRLYDKVKGRMQSGTLKTRILPAIPTTGLQRQEAQKLTQRVETLMRGVYDQMGQV